jgi:hypothetical protein
MGSELEELVEKFGSQHRGLIIDALQDIEEKHEVQGLEINKEEYIKNLLDKLNN